MSDGAFWFGVYLGTGFIIVTILMVSSKRRNRVADMLEPAADTAGLGAGFLIFVALLWPIWLLVRLTRDRE